MPDISFHAIQKGLRALGLARQSRVIVHTSLAAFGQVRGGAEAVVGALTSVCQLVVTPAFTYQCMVWPLVGPPNNGATYTGHEDENANAEVFRSDLPAHADMGVVAETLRRLPGAVRSRHPLLSFAAFGPEAEVVMSVQSLAEPFGPIGYLEEKGGDVLLLGVDHSVNTAIHYAEYRAGRKHFVRWALTPQGAVECVAWPGDSSGFGAIAPGAAAFIDATRIGAALAQRLPLHDLLRLAEGLIRADPTALLCAQPRCERCAAVRASARLPDAPAPQAVLPPS